MEWFGGYTEVYTPMVLERQSFGSAPMSSSPMSEEDRVLCLDLLDGKYDDEPEEAAITDGSRLSEPSASGLAAESLQRTPQQVAAEATAAAANAAAEVARAAASAAAAAAEVARAREQRNSQIQQSLLAFKKRKLNPDLEDEPLASGLAAESLPAALVSAVAALPHQDFRTSRLKNWPWNREPIWNASWDCLCQQQQRELQNWQTECSKHGFVLGGVEEKASNYACSRSLFADLELSIHEISACSEQYYIGITSVPVKRCLGKRYFGQEVYDVPGHCESYCSMQVLVHGDAHLIALLEVAHLLLRLGIDRKCRNIGKGGEHRGQSDTWSSLYIVWNSAKASSTQSLEDMIE